MKIRKLRGLRRGALVAIGVFLGHGAHADTVLDFNSIPAGQNENSIINQGFGSFAATSSDGYSVTTFGTPNIGLTWAGIGASDTEWDYYNDGGSVWTGVQLNDSDIGDTHMITLTPNSASAGVVVESFNFDPYYMSSERFTYNVSVLAGTNVVSGPTTYTFLSDAMKDHPANINYTGAPGQALKLRLDRVASTLGPGEVEGGAYNIAVDDIAFAQLPATAFPAGPQVVSVTPADGQTGVAATSYPYSASIGNGDLTLAAGSIQLRIDGSLVSPPPVITSTVDGFTNVSFAGSSLLSSGDHSYTLTYQDNLGATYTNEVDFSSIYAQIPTTYALPSGSGAVRGFTFRTVAIPQGTTNIVDSTIAAAVAQLSGTLIDPTTGAPYVNAAIPGTNADGSYNVDTVLNFEGDSIGGDEGDFPDDAIFPGLDTNAIPYNYFSTEALLYLDLHSGYYRLGVNSDDGFEVNALPPKGVPGSPIQLGLFNDGRGASDTLFDVLVTADGLYPFQVIYFQSAGDATEEFFSVTNLAAEGGVLINDSTDTNAIKSFRVVAPRFTSIATNGANVILNWAYGVPPFQVQFKTNLTDAVWSNIGSTTTNTTATVSIQTSSGFFRLSYSPP